MDTKLELQSISKGAIYSFLGNGAGALLEYIFILIIARISGAESVGLYFLMVVIITVISIITRLGLSEGTLRFVSIYNGKKDLAKAKGVYLFSMELVFIFSLCLSLLLFINARYLAGILDRPGTEIIIKTFALGLPFVSLFKISMSLFQALHEMKYIALLQGFFLPFSMSIIYLLLSLIWQDFVSVGVAFTVAYLLFSIIAWRCSIKLLGVGIAENYQGVGKLARYSLPMALVSLIMLTYGQLDIIILGWFKGAIEVGVLGVIFKLSFLCLAVSASVNYIFAPLVADLHHRKEIDKLALIFKSITRWTITLTLPIYFVILMNSWAVLRFFGKDYLLGMLPLFILCTGNLVDVGTGLVATILAMTGRNFLTLFNALLFLAINIILDVILIPKYGIIGAAVGPAVSLTMVNLIRLIQVYKQFKIHPYSLRLAIPAGMAVIMFLVIVISKAAFNVGKVGVVMSIIYSLIGLLIYFSVIAFTVHADDKEIFKYFMRRALGKTTNLWLEYFR